MHKLCPGIELVDTAFGQGHCAAFIINGLLLYAVKWLVPYRQRVAASCSCTSQTLDAFFADAAASLQMFFVLTSHHTWHLQG